MINTHHHYIYFRQRWISSIQSEKQDQELTVNQITNSLLPTSVSWVQSLSCVRLFATPWTAAHRASLSIINFQSSLRLMSIESVMPSNHLILCPPLLLPPSIFPNIRVFSNGSVLRIRWSKYWSFSFRVWYMLVPNLVRHFLTSPLILSSDWMSITKGTLQAPAEDGDLSSSTWITQRST